MKWLIALITAFCMFGTIEAQAADQPTPTPRSATTTPAPQTTYPKFVQRIVDLDDERVCDEVGWNMTPERHDSPSFDADLLGFCLNDGTFIGGTCLNADTLAADSLFPPSSGDMWIVCGLVAVNTGSDDIFVSPLDFSIVTSENQKYAYDPSPLIMTPNGASYGESIPPGQSVEMAISFVVDKDADRPLRVEYRSTLSFGEDEVGYLILDELPLLSSVGD